MKRETFKTAYQLIENALELEMHNPETVMLDYTVSKKVNVCFFNGKASSGFMVADIMVTYKKHNVGTGRIGFRFAETTELNDLKWSIKEFKKSLAEEGIRIWE